jgi:hypothetical protein
MTDGLPLRGKLQSQIGAKSIPGKTPSGEAVYNYAGRNPQVRQLSSTKQPAPQGQRPQSTQQQPQMLMPDMAMGRQLPSKPLPASYDTALKYMMVDGEMVPRPPDPSEMDHWQESLVNGMAAGNQSEEEHLALLQKLFRGYMLS